MPRLLLLFVAILFFSCQSKEQENWDDLQQVKVGISLKEATRTMRNAPDIVDTYNKDTLVLFYDSTFGSSDDYKIVISKKDSVVSKIGYGD